MEKTEGTGRADLIEALHSVVWPAGSWQRMTWCPIPCYGEYDSLTACSRPQVYVVVILDSIPNGAGSMPRHLSS